MAAARAAARADLGHPHELSDKLVKSRDCHQAEDEVMDVPKVVLDSNGATRVAYILGVPLAEQVVRQWPQMGEIVRTRQLVADVEGNFPELTLEVGRRLHLDDVVIVEWTCNYGDGRLYRNVTIGELEDGEVVRVTDYWGEPTVTPEWRKSMTDRLDMPGDGLWPDNEHLGHY